LLEALRDGELTIEQARERYALFVEEFARENGNLNGTAYTDCERPACRSIHVTKTKAPISGRASGARERAAY